MLSAAVLVASLAACGQDAATPAASDATDVRPSSTAKLAIVAPAAGAVVAGPIVRLKVDLSGAKIVDFTSTVLEPDEGHLHVLLDGRLISMTLGLEQAIPDVAPGSHVVRVEFVANDHAPFTPRVVREVTFEVS